MKLLAISKESGQLLAESLRRFVSLNCITNGLVILLVVISEINSALLILVVVIIASLAFGRSHSCGCWLAGDLAVSEDA